MNDPELRRFQQDIKNRAAELRAIATEMDVNVGRIVEHSRDLRMKASEITAMPDGFTPVVPFEECFDAQYGLEILSDDVEGEGLLRGRVPVRDVLLTDHGLVHGGVFASVAEALASRGTALSVIPKGFAAMGQANDTNVLELVSSGVIHVEARVVRRADDMWFWAVDARDEAGRLCAFSRVTVAVRPMRPHAVS